MKLHRFSASALALLAAWFVLSVLSACRQTPTSPSGTDNHDTCCNGSITLNVHDSSTGAHLTKGTYMLSGNGVRDTEHVRDNGTVVFSHLCPGTYEIVGTADGYNRHVEHYTLGCNDVQSHDFNLSPTTTTDCCGGAIILNVHDSATHNAMTGGTYVLSGNGTTQTQHISNGQVIFNHLCPGTYEVVGEADGYNRHVEHYTLGCNDEQHHDFNLSPVSTNDCCHGIITLVLRDSATGNAITGGTVTLWKGSTNLGSQTINATGNSWDGLCQGDGYSFSVTKDGYNHYEWGIDPLGCNEHRSTDRRIGTVQTNTNCDNASMTVTVVDSIHRDTKLSGVTVTIRVDGSSTIVAQGTTDSNGQFTANHLLGHTTYIVTFSKDGYNEKHFTWQFTDCRDYTETFGLSAK